MSRYTITIKNLIDNNFNFGLQDYPIFDETYRDTLNQKILNHYYEDEIGFETANLFKFYLNNKMAEIMPKYNTLYGVQKEIMDNNLWLGDTNIIESFTAEDSENNTSNSTDNTTNNSSTTSSNKNLFQDTPQGSLDTTALENQRWATNVTFDNGTDSTTNTIQNAQNVTSSMTGANNYLKTIIGNKGRKYNIEVLKDLESNFMNIDLMIIEDLSELFMGIL
jgi:hypothetical protein